MPLSHNNNNNNNNNNVEDEPTFSTPSRVSAAARFERRVGAPWLCVAKHHFHKAPRPDTHITVLENSVDARTGVRTIRRELAVDNCAPWWLTRLMPAERVRFVEEATVDERAQVLELRSYNVDFTWLGVAEERSLMVRVEAPAPAPACEGCADNHHHHHQQQQQQKQQPTLPQEQRGAACGDAAVTEAQARWVQEGGIRVSRWVAGPLAQPLEQLTIRLFGNGGKEALERTATEVGAWRESMGGVRELAWVPEADHARKIM